MSCLDDPQLAALAAGEDPGEVHVAACAGCAARLAIQIEARALVQGLAAPRLPSARRDQLAAAVLAHAELADDARRDHRPRRRRWAVVGGVVAAAAAAAIAVVSIRPARVLLADRSIAAVASRPGSAIATVAAAPGASYRHDTVGEREQIALDRGTITVERDAAAAPLMIVAGDTAIEVASGRVEVTSVDSVIVRAAVFAGSVEIVRAGQHATVEVGDVWQLPTPVALAPSAIASPALAPPALASSSRPRPDVAPGTTTDLRDRVASTRAPDDDPLAPIRAPDHAPVSPTRVTDDDPLAPASDSTDAVTPGLAAFRAGWEALRSGHPADAIAHLDRADDPAIAEDAAYWAAIASARAGHTDDATRRMISFLTRFPHSPRRRDAQSALATWTRPAPH